MSHCRDEVMKMLRRASLNHEHPLDGTGQRVLIFGSAPQPTRPAAAEIRLEKTSQFLKTREHPTAGTGAINDEQSVGGALRGEFFQRRHVAIRNAHPIAVETPKMLADGIGECPVRAVGAHDDEWLCAPFSQHSLLLPQIVEPRLDLGAHHLAEAMRVAVPDTVLCNKSPVISVELLDVD